MEEPSKEARVEASFCTDDDSERAAKRFLGEAGGEGVSIKELPSSRKYSGSIISGPDGVVISSWLLDSCGHG